MRLCVKLLDWNLEFGTWSLELGTWNLELWSYLQYFSICCVACAFPNDAALRQSLQAPV